MPPRIMWQLDEPGSAAPSGSRPPADVRAVTTALQEPHVHQRVQHDLQKVRFRVPGVGGLIKSQSPMRRSVEFPTDTLEPIRNAAREQHVYLPAPQHGREA
jgi:hypothetical protein